MTDKPDNRTLLGVELLDVTNDTWGRLFQEATPYSFIAAYIKNGEGTEEQAERFQKLEILIADSVASLGMNDGLLVACQGLISILATLRSDSDYDKTMKRIEAVRKTAKVRE